MLGNERKLLKPCPDTRLHAKMTDCQPFKPLAKPFISALLGSQITGFQIFRSVVSVKISGKLGFSAFIIGKETHAHPGPISASNSCQPAELSGHGSAQALQAIRT